MLQQLTTFPFRASRRAAGVAFGIGARAVSLAWDVLEHARRGEDDHGDIGSQEERRTSPQRIDEVRNGRAAAPDVGARGRSVRSPQREPDRPSAGNEAGNTPEATAVTAPEVQDDPEIAAEHAISARVDRPEPAVDLSDEAADVREALDPDSGHIEVEAEVVAERADPGAVDGAGASIAIDEPWPGYNELNAQEIIDRLTTADKAQLAVAELYETTHKQRQTVLSAVEGQLNSARSDSASDEPRND